MGFIPAGIISNAVSAALNLADASYCDTSARASRWTNADNTSALTSETASQSMPEPLARATVKPRTVRAVPGLRPHDMLPEPRGRATQFNRSITRFTSFPFIKVMVAKGLPSLIEGTMFTAR
jgi:hypothetical protein